MASPGTHCSPPSRGKERTTAGVFVGGADRVLFDEQRGGGIVFLDPLSWLPASRAAHSRFFPTSPFLGSINLLPDGRATARAHDAVRRRGRRTAARGSGATSCQRGLRVAEEPPRRAAGRGNQGLSLAGGGALARGGSHLVRVALGRGGRGLGNLEKPLLRTRPGKERKKSGGRALHWLMRRPRMLSLRRCRVRVGDFPAFCFLPRRVAVALSGEPRFDGTPFTLRNSRRVGTAVRTGPISGAGARRPWSAGCQWPMPALDCKAREAPDHSPNKPCLAL